MAIPVGRTSRQLEWLARWTLAGVTVLGMLAWWWPGYASWATTAAGLLLVLVLWLVWRTNSARRTVPAHPIHAILAVPGAILTLHLASHGLTRAPGEAWHVQGALDMSMIFEFGLLALGVMLSQSLLPEAARHVAVLGVCGAAMMVGPAAAMLWAPAQPVRTALAMLGFGGVGVWLTMLWGAAVPGGSPPGGGPTAQHRALRWACVAVAVAAAGMLAVLAPLQAILMAGVLGATLLLAGLVFPARRVALLAAGGALAAGVLAALAGLGWVRRTAFELITRAGATTPLGRGEDAFRDLSAADNGIVVLCGLIGWVGTAVFLAGLAGCLGAMLVHARRGRGGDQARAILWTAAAGAVATALLSPGGLFVPAVVLAAAFVWGLLPAMLGRPERPRSGAYLAGAVGAVLLLEGVAAHPGLLLWSPQAFGAGDGLLHAGAGFLMAMLLAWLLGARRVGPGLLGIALAALLGLPGEAVQHLFSTRAAEFRDSVNHALGACLAVAPYLLCMGARWCESPDARPAGADLRQAPAP